MVLYLIWLSFAATYLLFIFSHCTHVAYWSKTVMGFASYFLLATFAATTIPIKKAFRTTHEPKR